MHTAGRCCYGDHCEEQAVGACVRVCVWKREERVTVSFSHNPVTAVCSRMIPRG